MASLTDAEKVDVIHAKAIFDACLREGATRTEAAHKAFDVMRFGNATKSEDKRDDMDFILSEMISGWNEANPLTPNALPLSRREPPV